MLRTVEVRWFFKGVPPLDVWEWFDVKGCESDPSFLRVDHYLRLEEGDSLGVKLREGRIEVKRRNDQQEVMRLGRCAEGCVEQWRKWSFALAETIGAVEEVGDNSFSWIGVKKERKIQTYQVTKNQTVVQANRWDDISQGCTWEVAMVNIDGMDDMWWSVGFEAFGSEAELRDTILLVAENVLSMITVPGLRVENSYGYPRWLRDMAKVLP